MARIKVYTEEESKARHLAVVNRNYRAKVNRLRTEKWQEVIKYIRQHDFSPTEELAVELNKKWRVLPQREYTPRIDK